MTTNETAVYELRNVSRTYTLGGVEVHAVRELELTLVSGRVGRDRRAERIRQDDAAPASRRARPAQRRRDPLRGTGHRTPRRPRALRSAPRRVSASSSSSSTSFRRSQRLRMSRSRWRRRASRVSSGASGCSAFSRQSASQSAPTTCPASSREASSSVSQSLARSQTSLTCCSRTSRPATSTPRPVPRSWISCSPSRATSSRRTVIVVTHDAGVAARAERVLRMRDGRLRRRVGESSDLLSPLSALS